jgi:hypothetical protein
MTFTISSSGSPSTGLAEVQLSPKTVRAIRTKAKRARQTPAEYIKFLIERDMLADRTFDEILRPIRKDVQASGLTPDKLDAIVDRARRRYHSTKQRRK